jgi:hypothetical protein
VIFEPSPLTPKTYQTDKYNMERKPLAQIYSWLPILALALTTACTREAAKDSKISIQLPPAASSLAISHSVSAFSTKWMLNDPGASNQLNCYAIAIEPMGSANANSCYKQNGDIVARPAVIHGGFPAGSTQEIEVESGAGRKIYLIGFQTDNISKCSNVNSTVTGLDPNHFSSPFILDSVIKDFAPGTVVEVALTVPASIPAAGKFEECTPYQFGKVSSLSPLTIAAIAPSSGPLAGGQSVVITGTGFTATSTATIGGSPCTSLVITPTSISCTTPARAAGTVDVAVTRGVEVATLSSAYTYVPSPALLSLSLASPFIFGTLPNGGSISQSFTLTNGGDSTATSIAGAGLAAPFSFLGGSYPGAGGTCASTLASSASCTIVVSFAPTVSGAHVDDLDINYNDGTAPQTLTRNLQGAGANPASLTISNTGYDYGIVTTGALSDVTLTITNTGGVPATALSGSGLAAPFIFKGGVFPGTGGTCPSGGSLAPAGATCTIVVSYTPASTGVHSDTVFVDYNNGLGAQSASNTIQGTGVSPALLSITDGPTYDYGTIVIGAPASSKSFTVTNSGASSATAISYGGISAPFTFGGGTCGATLSAGGSCTVVVDFAPGGTGPYNQNLDITYHDGAVPGVSASRPITGTGTTAASLAISDPGYAFPLAMAGSNLTKSFTVTNSGGAPATSLNGYGLNPPYSFNGGSYPGTGGTCAATLAGGASCDIVVSFAPTADGASSDTIELDYNDGVSPQSVTRLISGTADVTPPVAITFSSPVTSTTNADLIPIDIVFSEPVAGNFTSASLYSAQGTIVQFSGSGANYKALFAPTATHPSVQLVIPGNGSQDLAGNWQPNASTTLTWNFTMPQGQSSVMGLPSAPAAARHPAAVWLGATWFIWGGFNGAPLSGGAIYDPATNAWTAINATAQPTPRDRAAVAYDGRHVYIWGGNSSSPLSDGKYYDTSSMTWANMATAGAPSPRHSASAVSFGNHFLVWGGNNNGGPGLNTGAMYNAGNNTWTSMTNTGAPLGRFHHAAVMAGNYMVIWGGNDGMGGILNHGGRFNMSNMTWTTMSTAGAPSAREDFSYVWTGRKLIVWGGSGPGGTLLNDGAMYDPVLDTWSPMPGGGDVPMPRAFAQAVWTGTHMIISGGKTDYGASTEHFSYDIVSGQWTRLRASIAEPRVHHVVAWTGSKLLEWGGESAPGSVLNTGSVLDPQYNGTRIKDITMSSTHTCALLEGGRVKCWGQNAFGALGRGDTVTIGDGAGEMGASLPFVDLGTGKSALKLALGTGFSCALLNDFNVKCWGQNDVGQLGLSDLNHRGDGAGEMGSSLVTLNMAGQRIVDIAAGAAHACAVTEYGQVKCWGEGANGQLGNGANTASSTPVTVSNITNGAVDVAAGDAFTCVRTFNEVRCFGQNATGQLGDGTTNAANTPSSVSSLMNAPVRMITGKGSAVCATLPGLWQCWGSNVTGNLGDNTSTNRMTPTAVFGGGPSMTHLSQGGTHACAIEGSSLKCWGANSNGQLGVNSTTSTMSLGSAVISYASGVLGVTAAANASCAWYETGEVRCWGQGSSGRLGMGNTNSYGTSGFPMSGLGAGISLF